MRLMDLAPKFLRYETRREIGRFQEGDKIVEREIDRQIMIPVLTIAEAQGVRFLCPKCFGTNGGPVGTHSVICWSRSRGVPDSAKPGPGRWTLDGTGLHDLTLNGDPPGNARSVALEGGCAWHGFVTNGEAA